MNDADRDGLMHFWRLASQLKRLRRTGWLDRGVDDPESAADHSWGVALLGWLLAGERPDLDRERVLLLGLVHDLPEGLAGDRTPFDEHREPSGAIDAERFREPPVYSDAARFAKRQAEEAALDEMLRGLAPELGDDIRAAWREYEADLTPEARFVRQIDKLETLIQAVDYLARQPTLAIESFWLGARRDITDPGLLAVLEALTRRGTG